MTPKRNSCVNFAFGYTRLKMYGKGTKIDEIRERTTIDKSFDISQLNVVIALIFFRACVAYHRQYLSKVSIISIENKWSEMHCRDRTGNRQTMIFQNDTTVCVTSHKS